MFPGPRAAQKERGRTLQKFEAVKIVEALRSGVSSRYLASIFSYGREAVLESIQRDLEAIAGGKESRAVILRGDYGEGKTHFLNIVFNQAQMQNFVVSFVVLSKETPFSRLDRVYPKVVSETYLPGETEPGLEALFRDIRAGSTLAGELLGFAQDELHPKLAYVLKNYLEPVDSYQSHLLLSDFAGDWLPLAQLKSMHRFNFGQPAKIKKFTPRLHAWDYFRFLAHLIKVRGFAGWVILFDEFELVGTLGIAARSEAYSNLGHFFFSGGAGGLEATYVFFGVFSGFWSLRLLAERRPDITEVPAWLLAKGDPRKAEMVKRTLNALLQNNITFEALPNAEVRRILTAVQDAHALAYGWEPQADLERILEVTRYDRLRTKIRYALEYLDLKYLYQEEPVVQAERPAEVSLGTFAEFEEEAVPAAEEQYY